MITSPTNYIFDFRDIYIFYSLGEGYISLSDFEFSDLKNGAYKYKFQEKTDFLIGLPTNTHTYYIAPISLTEILALANVSENTHFVKQFKCNLYEDFADTLLAINCAKKIMEYNYGRISLKKNCDGFVFTFERRKTHNKKKVYTPVFEKLFKKVDVT